MNASLSRDCPVCKETSQRLPVFAKGSLRLVRCPKCSMVFAAQVPPSLQSGAFYSEIGEAFYLSDDKLKGDYSPVRFERELKIFRRFCKTGKVLDIGCSSGGFLHALERDHPGSYERLGNDVSLPAVEFARTQGVPVLAGDILTLDLPLNSFDAVCFWAVLEHLMQPSRFLTRAWELLRPGGHCFILVPNFKSLNQRILGPKYRYVLPQHVNYFTLKTLALLTAEKFKIELTTTTHFNPIVLLQDFRSSRDPTDEDRAQLLVRTNKMKQRKLLRPLKLLYQALEKTLAMLDLADNCLLVARKPE